MYFIIVNPKGLAIKYLFRQQTAIDWRNSVLVRSFIKSRDSQPVSAGVYVSCMCTNGFLFFSLFFLIFHTVYTVRCEITNISERSQFGLCAIFGCGFSKDGYINRLLDGSGYIVFLVNVEIHRYSVIRTCFVFWILFLAMYGWNLWNNLNFQNIACVRVCVFATPNYFCIIFFINFSRLET